MTRPPERMAEVGDVERRAVVLVCRTDERPAKAAGVLRGAGFADLAVLCGGMERWNRARLPIERRLRKGNRRSTAREGSRHHQ